MGRRSPNPCPLHSEDERDAENGPRHSDGVSEAPSGRLLLGRLLMSVLGGMLGMKGELRHGSQRQGMTGGAAANEIQGTTGADRRRGPREKSARKEDGWGDLALRSSVRPNETISWARASPSSPARGSKTAPPNPRLSNQCKRGLGFTCMTPSLLTMLALLPSFKPAHRTRLSDISPSEFYYGFM